MCKLFIEEYKTEFHMKTHMHSDENNIYVLLCCEPAYSDVL